MLRKPLAGRWPMLLTLPFCLLAQESAIEPDQTSAPLAGCSFRSDAGLNDASVLREELFARLHRLPGKRLQFSSAVEWPPRRSFVDDEIFARLETAGVQPARLSSDEEFVRRIHLDLTGQIPSAAKVRQFVAHPSTNKRELLIDELLGQRAFTDKWAVWFGDLIQNSSRLSTSARQPYTEGRNALDLFLRDRLANNRPVREMVAELLTAKGNNFFTEAGAATYMVLASTAMGPVQDTYDMAMVRATSAFLGMSHYDCLSCHDGFRHLDTISLWGGRAKRMEAWKMSAFFSRTRWNNGLPRGEQATHPLSGSTDIQDVTTGGYPLNTTAGNRPSRCADGMPANDSGRCDRTAIVMPEYRDGEAPANSAYWRAFFAEKLVSDPMFGRNFANRLWKEFFGIALVEPLDTLDPDRLDPANPPPEPWKLQASHPQLLEKLANHFIENGSDLRGFIRLLVTSAAYQLSSRYDGEWRYEYLNLYARHIPRRLKAEEIVDAVAAATAVPGRYTWSVVNAQTVPRGTPLPQSEPVDWAMQLPGVDGTPTNNRAVSTLLDTLYRGNRDTAPRQQDGSILQRLSLMNDRVITDRLRVGTSPTLREWAGRSDNKDTVEQIFLTFLSRLPTAAELERGVAHLSAARSPTQRNTAIEDLAWVCVNKLDFVFSF
jgi:hypothetical protein